MSGIPSIPEFYSNKTILITGGSGFIGKVLIEKLLRSCPQIKTIYLLMREKHSNSPQERIKGITDLALFDVLKKTNPDALQKIKIINGDVKELALGMSKENQELLIQEVNIILHVAASVRFDDSLKDAVLMNTRGTRELVTLALHMKNLDVLVHVSTTYCHTDYKVIDEILYPPHADWKKTIEIVENLDKHVIDAMTEKYIEPLPNTYTFSKSLAEHVVVDLCEGKIPLVVFRPSVVINSAQEPFPGWIDNFNGPMGLVAGFGKGVVRTVYCDGDIKIDYIPVDITVKAIIMASWKQATFKDVQSKLTPAFYNGSNDNTQVVTTKTMLDIGKERLEKNPLDYVLWNLNCQFTKCYYMYFIQMVLYHLIPAMLIDGLLTVLGKKPMLIKLHRRIYGAVNALSYFSFNEWEFVNRRSYNLDREILPCDVKDFSYNEEEIDVLEFFENAVEGIRNYLLKDTGDKETAKKHLRRINIIGYIFNTLWYLTIFWIIFVKLDVISMFVNLVLGYFSV